MYAIAFGITGLIFAYVSTKASKTHYQIMFALIALQCCALGGASVVNSTSNYGDMFYMTIVWILIIVPTLYAIELIANSLNSFYSKKPKKEGV